MEEIQINTTPASPETSTKSQVVDKLIYGTIISLLIIIPITIHLKIVDFISPLVEIELFASGKKGELFTFYEFIFLITGATFLLALFLYKVIVKKYKLVQSRLYVYICALVFSLSISTFLSSYKHLALYGMYNSNSGFITYFCYFIIFIIIINTKFSKKQLLGISLSTIPFLILNLILGLLSIYNVNILNYSWMRWFLGFSGELSGLKINSNITLDSTLPNQNYVSGVASILFALFFSYMLFTNKRLIKGTFFLLTSLSLLLIFTSMSQGGTLIFIILFPVLLLLSIFKMPNFRKINILLSTLLLIIGVSSIFYLSKLNSTIMNETLGVFESAVKAKNEISSYKGPMFANPKLNGDYTLPTFPESGYGPGSGRLYIWEKVIEVWKNSPVFGTGFDTLPMVIDHYDKEKIASLGTYTVFIGKPHNIYLGWLYGSGALGFLLFLALLIDIGLNFFKTILKKPLQIEIIAFGFASLAYCIQALFYDAIIGSSIIFWIFLGILSSKIIKDKDLPKSF